jgi:hypothetical protein
LSTTELEAAFDFAQATSGALAADASPMTSGAASIVAAASKRV